MTLDVTVERQTSSEESVTLPLAELGVTTYKLSDEVDEAVLPGAVAAYVAELTLLSPGENPDCGDCGTPGTSDVLLVPTPMQ